MKSPKEVAIIAAKALDEKKGHNVKLLRIDRVSSLADHFLICTGNILEEHLLLLVGTELGAGLA